MDADMTSLPVVVYDDVPRFNLATAKYLAECCFMSYSGVTLQSEKTDAGVLIVELPNCIVLACRGTRNIRDWLQDARFLKRGLGGGSATGILVHEGFNEDADSLLGQIIERLGATTKPIIITGHSLGGGFGSVIAYALSLSNLKLAAVYTFASPRVGNATWRDAYDFQREGFFTLGARTWRVAAAGDCVPLVPGIFCPPLDGYRHVGQEVYLSSDADYGFEMQINPSRWMEFFGDQHRCALALARRDFDFLLEFHSIDRDYIPLLNKCQT